jgi:hypothetical protein
MKAASTSIISIILSILTPIIVSLGVMIIVGLFVGMINAVIGAFFTASLSSIIGAIFAIMAFSWWKKDIVEFTEKKAIPFFSDIIVAPLKGIPKENGTKILRGNLILSTLIMIIIVIKINMGIYNYFFDEKHKNDAFYQIIVGFVFMIILGVSVFIAGYSIYIMGKIIKDAITKYPIPEYTKFKIKKNPQIEYIKELR